MQFLNIYEMTKGLQENNPSVSQKSLKQCLQTIATRLLRRYSSNKQTKYVLLRTIIPLIDLTFKNIKILIYLPFLNKILQNIHTTICAAAILPYFKTRFKPHLFK